VLTLMRKDLRLLRPVLVTALAVAVAFCVVLPLVSFVGWQQAGRPSGRAGYGGWNGYAGRDARVLAGMVRDGADWMTVGCLALYATVGGAAFAHERRERWADGLAVLPVARRRIVAAKGAASLLVCVGGTAGVLLLRAAADGVVRYGVSAPFVDWPAAAETMGLYFLPPAVALFGVAWLRSSLTSSATVSAVVALGAAGGGWFWTIGWVRTRDMVHAGEWRYTMAFCGTVAATYALGLAAAAAGTLVQVRRTSP
jgi:hypothetical protein